MDATLCESHKVNKSSALRRRMLSKEWISTLTIFGILFLLVLFTAQITEYNSLFIVRPAIQVKEPFVSGEPVVKGVTEMNWNAAEADIADQRTPYNLLKGVLPSDGSKLSGMSAQRCYEADFENRLMTSSRKQMTNNYQRLNPDSCTAPFTELVTSFYKVDPLPAA